MMRDWTKSRLARLKFGRRSVQVFFRLPIYVVGEHSSHMSPKDLEMRLTGGQNG